MSEQAIPFRLAPNCAVAGDLIIDWNIARAQESDRSATLWDPQGPRAFATRLSAGSPPPRKAMLLDPALISEDDPEVDRWLALIQSAGAFEEESWFALSAADSGRFRRSGALKMNTDDAVPLARNREMLAYYRASLERELPAAT